MPWFSFRAECIGDVCDYLRHVGAQFRIQHLNLIQDECYPDVEAQLVVSASSAELKAIAREIEDAHIIEESLALNAPD